MTFLENIGNASTTASRNGKQLGNNVNASAYIKGNDIIIKLESNAAYVRGVANITMSKNEYAVWLDNCPSGLSLLLHGLRLFNCKTAFDA